MQEVYRGRGGACSVEGLNFDTEYRARVKATSRVGSSAHSGVVRIHTAKGAHLLGRHFRVDLTKPVSNVCPPVRPSVRPQKLSSISMKFSTYVEVDE